MAAPRVAAYLELLRLHNVAVSVLTMLIGYVAASAATECTACSRVAAAAVAVGLIAAGGYVINDYYDVETDSIAKPWRPIPSGRVSRRAARVTAYMLLAAGLVAAATLGPTAFIFAAVNALLVHEYSRWIKRTGFIGNIMVALNSAATILMGALACGSEVPGAIAAPAAIAFGLVLGREIVKGIEDYHGDKETCYYTLPVLIGLRKAAMVAAAILLLVATMSPLPYLLGGYGKLYLAFAAAVDATILHSIYVLVTTPGERLIAASAKLRSTLKVSFLLGALAFLLGAYV